MQSSSLNATMCKIDAKIKPIVITRWQICNEIHEVSRKYVWIKI